MGYPTDHNDRDKVLTHRLSSLCLHSRLEKTTKWQTEFPERIFVYLFTFVNYFWMAYGRGSLKYNFINYKKCKFLVRIKKIIMFLLYLEFDFFFFFLFSLFYEYPFILFQRYIFHRYWGVRVSISLLWRTICIGDLKREERKQYIKRYENELTLMLCTWQEFERKKWSFFSDHIKVFSYMSKVKPQFTENM